MKTTKLLTILAVSSALFAMTAQSAFASSENREAVKEAIASGDYSTFAELTADSERFTTITADNFGQLTLAMELRQSGDHESAKEVIEELGLEPPHKRFNREARQAQRELVRTAVSEGDFDAFVANAPDKLLEKIDADNFAQFVEAHQLRESGDKEGAKEIMEALGIKRPHKGKLRGGNF